VKTGCKAGRSEREKEAIMKEARVMEEEGVEI
jgi:hypothetical protein